MTKTGAFQAALLDKIESKSAIVGIIGLGYVGLPLAIHFCEAGFKVIGAPISEKRLAASRQYLDADP